MRKCGNDLHRLESILHRLLRRCALLLPAFLPCRLNDIVDTQQDARCLSKTKSE